MRHLFAFAVITAILLVMSGCTQKAQPTVGEPSAPLVPTQNNTTVAPAPAAPCTGGNIVQNDECFLMLASQTNNSSICSSIYSTSVLDSCLFGFSSDINICRQITNASMRNTCLSSIAEAQKSQDICGLITNDGARLACLQKVVPPCQLITDPDARTLCMALDKGDYTLCTSDSCFLQYAINKSASDACILISSPSDKQACMAVVAKDVSVCKQAALVPVQDFCVQKASELLNDSNGCDVATVGTTYRNSCYAYFAVEYLDMGICARASPETARDTCYANYSVEVGDVSACAKIVDSLNQEACYYDSAAANSRPSLCNPLPTQSERNGCYSDGVYGATPPAASDCPLVDSTIWADKCYFEAARGSGNQSLCALISPGSDQDTCNSLFGIGG